VRKLKNSKTMMKKLLFILFTISTVLAFTACGSDDNTVKIDKYFNGECKLNAAIVGPAGSTITTAETTATLEDMLKNSTDFGTPITAGSLNLTEKTSIKVTGLKKGVTLKDFKLIINGGEKSFGDISNEALNTNLYNDASLNFFKDAFSRMVSEGSLKVKTSFTPSASIETADKVQVEILFYGKFTYTITQ